MGFSMHAHMRLCYSRARYFWIIGYRSPRRWCRWIDPREYIGAARWYLRVWAVRALRNRRVILCFVRERIFRGFCWVPVVSCGLKNRRSGFGIRIGEMCFVLVRPQGIVSVRWQTGQLSIDVLRYCGGLEDLKKRREIWIFEESKYRGFKVFRVKEYWTIQARRATLDFVYIAPAIRTGVSCKTILMRTCHERSDAADLDCGW